MNRRDLLKLMSYSTSAVLISCALKPGAVGVAIPLTDGPTASQDRAPGKIYFFRIDYAKANAFLAIFGLNPNIKIGQPTKIWLCEFDIVSGASREVQITDIEIPHSVLIDPKRNRLLCFPKIGKAISIVQLETFKETAHFFSRPGFYFYGHGAFSPDGAQVYVSQSAANGDGCITAHDADSYHELRVLESFGFSPHDLRFVTPDVLVVANNGWSELNLTKKTPSSLVWLDPRGSHSKLIRKIDMPSSELTVQHFAIEKGGDAETRILLGLDAPWPGGKLPEGVGLSASCDSTGLHMMGGDPAGIERMHRNTLSVDGDSVVGAILTTTPESHLSLWDSRARVLVNEFDSIKHPHGVNAFVVSKGEKRVDYFVTTAATGIYKLEIRRSQPDQPMTHVVTQLRGSGRYQNVLGHSTLA